MKKILLLTLVALLVLNSCKKDIHCNCKTEIIENNKSTVKYSYITVKNSTEKRAVKGQCSSYSIKTEPTRYYDDYGNRDTIYQTITNFECFLK